MQVESGEMSKHQTCLTFQQVRTYIGSCLGSVSVPPLDPSRADTPISILAWAIEFDKQAYEDSSHLWNLIISIVDDTMKSLLIK